MLKIEIICGNLVFHKLKKVPESLDFGVLHGLRKYFLVIENVCGDVCIN